MLYRYVGLLLIMGVIQQKSYSAQVTGHMNPEVEYENMLRSKVEQVLDGNREMARAKMLYLMPGELIDRKNGLMQQQHEFEAEIQREEADFCKQEIGYLERELNKNNIEAVSELIEFYQELGPDLKNHAPEGVIIRLYYTASKIIEASMGLQELAELQKAFSVLGISKEQTNPYQAKIDSLSKALEEGKIEAIIELISFYKEVGPQLKSYISEEDIQKLHDRAGTILFATSSISSGAKIQEYSGQLPSSSEFYEALQHVLT